MKTKTDLPLSIVTKDEKNDLLNTLTAHYGGITVYPSLDAALQDVPDTHAKGILVLADTYPDETTRISPEQASKINALPIRVYVEYPAENEALGITGYNGTGKMGYDRAVVTDSEALHMPLYSLLYVHGAQYVAKEDITRAWLVNALVAGYDVADFGLTDCTPYSLIEVNEAGNVMIASTKLSQFISARYAPYERWQQLWCRVLSWVAQSEVTDITWTPALTARYAPDAPLPDNAYREAVDRNMQWYIRNMLADNGEGFYQCFNAGNCFDVFGNQKLNRGVRADCTGESIGAMALAGVLLENDEYKAIAHKAMEWMLTRSKMAGGDRADPQNAQYGLLSWYDDEQYLGNYYGDDNAKAILGLMLGAAALKTDKYDKRILEAILGNFRTTGVLGFRGAILMGGDLEKNGWEYYYDRQDYVSFRSHFEALLWACYLWVYDKTAYEPLLTRSKTAISRMMAAYRNTVSKEKDGVSGEWTWTNGMQQERAKMILPLAWLVRLQPTEEHLRWLDTMIEDMMVYQDETTGALRDVFGEPHEGTGRYGPFVKNSDYGKHESPVIQNNGDPCTDSLYTSSFAMMTLNEAAAAMEATGNDGPAAKYRRYARSISDYHVRIQQVSSTKPAFDGVWFRGFDYKKWEAYGSDGDAGWGIWSTETGWCQAWISAALSMESMDINIWDYTKSTTIEAYFADTVSLMLTPGVKP